MVECSDLLQHLIWGHAPWEVGFPSGSVSKESACNEGDLVRSLGQEGPLEEEMATHSSVIAWEFPRTEEPGRLQSMGSQELDTTEWLNHRHLMKYNKYWQLIYTLISCLTLNEGK